MKFESLKDETKSVVVKDTDRTAQ